MGLEFTFLISRYDDCGLGLVSRSASRIIGDLGMRGERIRECEYF